MTARSGIVLTTVSCLSVVTAGQRPLNDVERAEGRFTLRNPHLEVVLMVPGQPSSAYDGPRYEAGGVVLQVRLDGKHTFLGEEGRGKRLGGYGLIEEMGIEQAIGYDDAKPGEPFLKLGVGLIERGRRPEYSFYEALPFAERFAWDVSVGPRAATFVQTGKLFKGYAYRYEKQLALDAEKPILHILHVLANTGNKPIEATQYNHNYFRFGDASPGPDYTVTASFPLEPDREDPGLRIEGRVLHLTRTVKKSPYARFKGQPPDAEAHRIEVRHVPLGLAVVATGDFPVSHMAFWASTKALCPEAFVAIRVAPGETFRWTRTYEFLTGD